MSATTPEKKAPLSLAYYVHSLVCLCIMFGFGLLDPVEPLTPLGMRLVGVFSGGKDFVDAVLRESYRMDRVNDTVGYVRAYDREKEQER